MGDDYYDDEEYYDDEDYDDEIPDDWDSEQSAVKKVKKPAPVKKPVSAKKPAAEPKDIKPAGKGTVGASAKVQKRRDEKQQAELTRKAVAESKIISADPSLQLQAKKQLQREIEEQDALLAADIFSAVKLGPDVSAAAAAEPARLALEVAAPNATPEIIAPRVEEPDNDFM